MVAMTIATGDTAFTLVASEETEDILWALHCTTANNKERTTIGVRKTLALVEVMVVSGE